MFGLFKKSKKEVVLLDLDGNQLSDGDLVDNLRYEMGESRLIRTEEGFEYESLKDGRRVSWRRMIDAATERQKVRLKNS